LVRPIAALRLTAEGQNDPSMLRPRYTTYAGAPFLSLESRPREFHPKPLAELYV